ncbi:N-acetylmuramoyl-L-alanine amidase [Celeribacter litoreus]|uniref:N-acetylmuramoyl-L-alanine amidase n=1 Tax=Celeribacter litoreus TaxID=2876714 RepID=UPI001CCC38F0|nr:N-acetylmuramoyl-L-alanine amidase [Celeribacter litoreus]MCA0042937.1 N-acetylmuramoyl-L-alanine amidase [Celeribacter litoreus]
MVVIHYTAMPTAEDALARLCAPEFEVSAHYLICEQGQVHRLVDEEMRAWHAGEGQWGDVTDVNSRSIGIELANTGTTPFAADQIGALETLLSDIMTRWSIPPERIIGHSDMAPERKIDPGPRFDWRRLALRGLSVFSVPESDQKPHYVRFVQALHTFGYPDAPFEALLHAFRSRFRPHHTGPLDGVDMAMAQDLAERFPVDRSAPSA